MDCRPFLQLHFTHQVMPNRRLPSMGFTKRSWKVSEEEEAMKILEGDGARAEPWRVSRTEWEQKRHSGPGREQGRERLGRRNMQDMHGYRGNQRPSVPQHWSRGSFSILLRALPPLGTPFLPHPLVESQDMEGDEPQVTIHHLLSTGPGAWSTLSLFHLKDEKTKVQG